jgi:hypothetical protein
MGHPLWWEDGSVLYNCCWLSPKQSVSWPYFTVSDLSLHSDCNSSQKLCYDRRSVGQSVLVSSPTWGPRPDSYYSQTVAGLLTWGVLSDKRRGLSFTTAAGPRQRSHSQVLVPRDSWPYFTVSDSRLPHPGGPGPHIYIPQEQGGPVMTSGTGFPFCRLLRLAGLRWRYSNPPPRGDSAIRSQSQSFFTTGDLPPIKSSWCQDP